MNEIARILMVVPFPLEDAIALDRRLRTKKYQGESLLPQDERLWKQLSEMIVRFDREKNEFK